VEGGFPRDAGVGWDFEDVRDHYVRLLVVWTRPNCASVTSSDISRWADIDWRVDAPTISEWRPPRVHVPGRAGLVCVRLATGSGLGRARFRWPSEGGVLVPEASLRPGGLLAIDEGSTASGSTL
jgi:beta-mannosidase